jgi:hypothetical protein
MRAADGKRKDRNGVCYQKALSQFSIHVFENGPDYLHYITEDAMVRMGGTC